MRTKLTTLSIGAVATLAILLLAIATTVSSINSAYANGSKSESKQTKILAENKCANVGDHNRDIDIHDINCQNSQTTISCPKGSTCIFGKLEPFLLPFAT
jgi:hypothetical protein